MSGNQNTNNEVATNNQESKISFELALNSKGFTHTLKVYQGTTQEEINKVIDQVIAGNNYAQGKLPGGSNST